MYKLFDQTAEGKMIPTDRKPSHPGEVLQEEFLKPAGLSLEQFVRHLGKSWSQSKLSRVINKRSPINAAIALDFADALGTSPQFWLNLQVNYNLWSAKKEHAPVSILPKVVALESEP